MIDKDLLSAIEDNEEHPAIARLVEIGRQKSFITFDDILHLFPEAESDVDQLEEVFAALLSAGIPYVEESEIGGPTEEELAEEEIEEDSRRVLAVDDNYLANIDTDDTIGPLVPPIKMPGSSLGKYRPTGSPMARRRSKSLLSINDFGEGFSNLQPSAASPGWR